MVPHHVSPHSALINTTLSTETESCKCLYTSAHHLFQVTIGKNPFDLLAGGENTFLDNGFPP